MDLDPFLHGYILSFEPQICLTCKSTTFSNHHTPKLVLMYNLQLVNLLPLPGKHWDSTVRIYVYSKLVELARVSFNILPKYLSFCAGLERIYIHMLEWIQKIVSFEITYTHHCVHPQSSEGSYKVPVKRTLNLLNFFIDPLSLDESLSLSLSHTHTQTHTHSNFCLSLWDVWKLLD